MPDRTKPQATLRAQAAEHARREREAAALRENLRRRKAQARAREQTQDTLPDALPDTLPDSGLAE